MSAALQRPFEETFNGLFEWSSTGGGSRAVILSIIPQSCSTLTAHHSQSQCNLHLISHRFSCKVYPTHTHTLMRDAFAPSKHCKRTAPQISAY